MSQPPADRAPKRQRVDLLGDDNIIWLTTIDGRRVPAVEEDDWPVWKATSADDALHRVKSAKPEWQWPRDCVEPERHIKQEHFETLSNQDESASTLGKRKRTGPDTPTTSVDRGPREDKDPQYRDQRCEMLLATAGCSFMSPSPLGLATRSERLCHTLLETKQTVPETSLFHGNLFKETCNKLRTKNHARIIRDISQLIVPSAETLALYGAKHLSILAESVNEVWKYTCSVPGLATPQPDYSVGFREGAFTESQRIALSRLPKVSGISFFQATAYMHLPFLSCEMASLDVADRQNAHSMTLAVQGVAMLFRSVGREHELHRQILAFSVSYDQEAVRIYGHYPVIDGNDIQYHRHLIKDFSFTANDGRERWTAYQFVRNVYDFWMPEHFGRICSALKDVHEKHVLRSPLG